MKHLYDVSLERAALGAILLDYRCYPVIARHLSSQDFCLDSHRKIYASMDTLARTCQPIDLITMRAELSAAGLLADIGGAAYLASLTNGVPGVSNVEHYARKLAEKALLRRIIVVCESMKLHAIHPTSKPEQVLSRAQDRLKSLHFSEKDSPGILVSEVKPEPLKWLWRDRIPLGKITVLDGDPGLGKSTLALDIAARITVGAGMPDGSCGVAGGVVILSSEDGLADTIRPRLDAAGADLQKARALISVDGNRCPEIPRDIPILEQAIASVNGRLVIIDPVMAYLGSGINSWRDQDVRRALAPLAAMADRTGVAVLVIRHLNKSRDGNPLYRGGGSIGIVGAARSGLLVAADPENPNRRILAATKANLSKLAPSLGYSIGAEGPSTKIVWLGECQQTASDLVHGTGEEVQTPVQDAISFLRDELGNGPVEARKVQREARAAGISDRTLERAKQVLKIKSRRLGFGEGSKWMWALPTLKDATNVVIIGSKEANTADLAAFAEATEKNAVNPETSTKGATSGAQASFDDMKKFSGDETALTEPGPCKPPGIPDLDRDFTAELVPTEGEHAAQVSLDQA